jgi:hypothetical protein
MSPEVAAAAELASPALSKTCIKVGMSHSKAADRKLGA